MGTRGNAATFAFYANKQMTTGEGGMIVPPDAAAAARLRSERNQGRAADMGWLDHGGIGFNYRLGDLAAALGVAQVERLDAMLQRRAEVAGRSTPSALADLDGVEAPVAGSGPSARSWFVYPVRLAPEIDRDAVIAAPRRARHRRQGLPSLHPPLPAPARARLSPRASSRSPKRPRAARWRCPSSPRSRGPRSSGCARLSPIP